MFDRVLNMRLKSLKMFEVLIMISLERVQISSSSTCVLSNENMNLSNSPQNNISKQSKL